MPWNKGEPECGGSELGGPPPHALLRQTLRPLPLERAPGLGPEAGWPSRPVPSPPPRGGLCFRLVPDRPMSPTSPSPACRTGGTGSGSCRVILGSVLPHLSEAIALSHDHWGHCCEPRCLCDPTSAF